MTNWQVSLSKITHELYIYKKKWFKFDIKWV